MNRAHEPGSDPGGIEFLLDLGELSLIGATPSGGVHREAGSSADGETRNWLCAWLKNHGFEVRVDEIGNIFGIVEFLPGAPFVLAGSHLDSQPTAGRLDGAYGVLAAAHAARSVCRAVEAGSIVPKVNLAVVDWFNEEGSRFTPSVMGSGVYAGKLDISTCLNSKDLAGVTVAKALEEIGYRGVHPAPKAVAYSEIHIEQGRILEDEQIDIGIVESNWAVSKFELTLIGEQSHTGATLLGDRRDALVAAAEMIVALRDLASREQSGSLLASVGRISVYPNSPVVVPSKVVVTVDIRSPHENLLDRALREFLDRATQIAARESVQILRQDTTVRQAVAFPEDGMKVSESAAEACDLSHRRMATRAGHDSVHLNSLVPTIMAFVPSKSGISHNEAEDTDDGDLLNGLTFFTEVLGRLISTGTGESVENR